MKLTFLASRNVPTLFLIKIYDWATEIRDHNVTIISGFHSKVEKDVFHFLSKGKQPMKMVLARSMYRQLPDELKPLVQSGQLEILTLPGISSRLSSQETAMRRNRYMIEMADEVVIGYASPGETSKNSSKNMKGLERR
ncbi:MAG: DNA-binding protein [Ignavibacteriales bacterium]|nr:DNA-binding protein [Ignavibacteriales bacterium]